MLSSDGLDFVKTLIRLGAVHFPGLPIAELLTTSLMDLLLNEVSAEEVDAVLTASIRGMVAARKRADVRSGQVQDFFDSLDFLRD